LLARYPDHHDDQSRLGGEGRAERDRASGGWRPDLPDGV